MNKGGRNSQLVLRPRFHLKRKKSATQNDLKSRSASKNREYFYKGIHGFLTHLGS